MWKDIERISGVPFSRRSTSDATVRYTNNSSLQLADGHTNGDSEETRRLNALRSALNKENESNASIRAELSSAKVALIDASTRANEVEETNRLLLQSVDQLRQENETKSNEVFQLTAAKAAQLDESQAKINELEQTIFLLTTSNDDLVTNLEVKQQEKLEKEMEIKTLEERINSIIVEKEAAQTEMRHTLVKLEQTQQQLKDSEAREQDAQVKQSEAAEEFTKRTAKFQVEHESMTKVHNADIERYKLKLQNATTQINEMEKRLVTLREEHVKERNGSERKMNETTLALQTTRLELGEMTSQCEMQMKHIEKMNDEAASTKNKLESMQKENADRLNAAQSLIDKLERQVEETRDMLQKERSTNAASLSVLEHTIIATIRDNFSAQRQGADASESAGQG